MRSGRDDKGEEGLLWPSHEIGFGGTAEPQISPLRSPGFPVKTRGFDRGRACGLSLRRTAHVVVRQQTRSRKSGYAPVEMTKGKRGCGS